jgi:peptide/nickel transport system substrate-binding protein
MKHTALPRIAAVSALILIVSAFCGAIWSVEAARRPRYGGELRIEMRVAPENPEALEKPEASNTLLAGAIFENLVRLDEHGDPQPWLATSWTHDPARKRWVFTPRANVILHNGAPWSPGVIEFPDDQPIETLLLEQARSRNAVIVRAPDGSVVGTGPFRVAHWEAGRIATLAAHDQYWGGRPFLDSVQISMGRTLREQALDFEVGKADAIEISPAQRVRGSVYVSPLSSPLSRTLALEFDEHVPIATREAVALSVDRTAIYNVLLQKTGEISGALLPRWLSGYAFLFPAERNLARAKQLAPGAALSFGYDRQDSMIRAIGERISVNASEAGIALKPAAGAAGPADIRLRILPITSRDARASLEDIANLIKAPVADAPLYEAERALLADFRVVPLFHLPEAWSLSPRVRNWPRLADVWLDTGAKP